MSKWNHPREGDASGIRLPARVVVSLRAGAVLAVANVICVLIIAWAYTHVKNGPKIIKVTGSAQKVIQSDLAIWKGHISVNNPDLVAGYRLLKEQTDQTVSWLKKKGIPDSALTVAAVLTSKNFARDAKGNQTDKVTSYDLVETIQITSGDVKKIGEIASAATELIAKGIVLQSDPPVYIYTKLADLKVAMLAEATRDATDRARQIADNSGAKLGPIRDARMGVMQINALHENEVSGYGVSDTSSLKKQITAVVGAQFELQ